MDQWIKDKARKDSRYVLGAFIYAICIALIAGFLMFGYCHAEGTKSMSNAEFGWSIQVPELAPEFLNWPFRVLGSETYENGKALAVTQHISPCGNIEVMALWLLDNTGAELKGQVLAFGAYYNGKDLTLYEDTEFTKTGKPSGIFKQVPDATPLQVYRDMASRTMAKGIAF